MRQGHQSKKGVLALDAWGGVRWGARPPNDQRGGSNRKARKNGGRVSLIAHAFAAGGALNCSAGGGAAQSLAAAGSNQWAAA